ncbi:MAG: sigma-54 interaction domain-containing protein [Sandaracinaceae bacterium]
MTRKDEETSPRRRVGVIGHGPALDRLREDPTFLAVRVEPGGSARVERDGVRLVVVDAAATEDPVAAVRAMRRTSPLVDVIVFAPGASAWTVRNAWRADAADVVLGLDELLPTIGRVIEDQQLLPRIEQLARHRARGSRFEGLLSRNHRMWDIFELVVRIAPTDATVLILAETGSGKELLARAIHRRSKRRGRFAAVNCSSLPPQLAESELVGHERGAFTGAERARQGVIRFANEGTLFLDEIGDMPEQAQVSLLRVLQEGTVRPVGGHQEVPVDVRVIAATHVDLEQAVEDGRFRADLFYRLDVIRVAVPPLRERREDIVYLFGHFLSKLCAHYKVTRPELSEGFLDELVRFDWPGNVRELENFTERVALGKKRTLTGGDVGRLLRRSEPSSVAPPEARDPDPIDVGRTLAETVESQIEDLERAYLDRVLSDNRGRVGDSAAQAGISRRTLLRKLKRYGLDKAHYRRGA